MASSINSMILVVPAVLTALFLLARKASKHSAPYPPGPRPIPILGNVRDLTMKEMWLRATKWAQEYGDVTYLHVLGQGLVFISGNAPFDLMEKRGAIYSDKPRMAMAGELCGCKDLVPFTSYGDQMRRQRKSMHRGFGLAQVPKYYPLLQKEIGPFLKQLIVSPCDYNALLRRYTGSLALLITYGHEVKSENDEYLLLAEECISLLSNRIVCPGIIWAVDVFPFLKHIPNWFPGASFKRNAAIWKGKFLEWVEKPYQGFKTSMQEGTAVSSFCSTLLEEAEADGSLTEQTEFDIKWTSASVYGASMDTTIVTVLHFLLAMMEHPEILKKAQMEIDTVIGNSKLPNFKDRPRLPYVGAILDESFRWACPVPLAPHRVMEDDIYCGMLIPKGSWVFANIWSMARDEKTYSDPYTFKPERFLEKVDPETARRRNPRSFIFGFGRRRCPGAEIVDSSIWLLLASIIASVDIFKASENQERVIFEPQVNSPFNYPGHFECDIRPRSEQTLRIIQQTADNL